MLTLIAYVILPVYTLLFIRGSDLFKSNFSVHGNLPDNQLAFLLWGLFNGLYFYILIKKILNTMGDMKREKIIVNLSAWLLFMAVTTPYLPNEVPLRSFLHILFAFLSAILLLAELYLIVWQLYRKQRAAYGIYLYSLHFITAFSILLLLAAGIVSTALEFFFSIACVVLLCNLYQQVNRCCDTIR